MNDFVIHALCQFWWAKINENKRGIRSIKKKNVESTAATKYIRCWSIDQLDKISIYLYLWPFYYLTNTIIKLGYQARQGKHLSQRCVPTINAELNYLCWWRVAGHWVIYLIYTISATTCNLIQYQLLLNKTIFVRCAIISKYLRRHLVWEDTIWQRYF